MHPLSGALFFPYVPVGVTRGALVAHRHRLRFLVVNFSVTQNLYVPLSVSVERSCDPVFDGVGLAGFKMIANAFLVA